MDEELREYMREWRRGAAQRQGRAGVRGAARRLARGSVPEASGEPSRAIADFRNRRAQSGIVRAADFHGAGEIRGGARAAAAAEKKISPAEETMRLLSEGSSFQEIAQIRDRQLSTVVGLVADLVEKGKLKFDSRWVDKDKRNRIEEACVAVRLAVAEAAEGGSAGGGQLRGDSTRGRRSTTGEERMRRALLLALLCVAGQAAVVPSLSLEELIDQSQVIVQGRITRSWCAWDTGHKYIWTHHAMSCHRSDPGRRGVRGCDQRTRAANWTGWA